LLPSDPGGIQQELVAQDLPGAKVEESPFITTTGKPDKPALWKHAMLYGLYYAILANGLSILLHTTGNPGGTLSKWSGVVLMAVAVVVIQLAYRKAGNGYLTYGQGLGIAFLTMLCASVLVALYTYIFFKFDTSALEQIRLSAEEQLVNMGMSEDDIERALAISSRFQTPAIFAISAVFSMAFYGAVFGAIAAIFTKKQPPRSIFD
jgi:hypothetical protein